MDAVANYFSGLVETVGRNWNRFWFTPRDPFPLCVLRIFVGLACLYFLFSYSSDLVRWFGPHGLLPVENVQAVEQAADSGPFPVLRVSYLNLVSAPAALWTLHVIGMLVLVAFTIGLFTRVTSVLSLVVVLSYVHRGPILTGQFEPILTMMLFYLCLGPAGYCLSIDRLRRTRRQAGQVPAAQGEQPAVPNFLSAGVALRLLQVHLALFYLFMGLSKLGALTWWNGSAVWWLMAHTESRLLDLTFLHAVPDLVYFWTHLIVLFECSFPVLIWNRWARPLLLVVAVPMWLSLALITGLVSYCVMMLVANLVFVPPEALRDGWQGCAGRFGRRTGTDASVPSPRQDSTV